MAVAARTALTVAAGDPTLRQRLWARVERASQGLAGLDVFACPGSPAERGPIIPVILGGEAAAVAASSGLLDAGFHVPAIRPPTVPPRTCRLRIALSAAHEMGDIDALVAALRERLD